MKTSDFKRIFAEEADKIENISIRNAVNNISLQSKMENFIKRFPNDIITLAIPNVQTIFISKSCPPDSKTIFVPTPSTQQTAEHVRHM